MSPDGLVTLFQEAAPVQRIISRKHFEKGQLVFTGQYGACLYLETAVRSLDPDRAEYDVQLLFGDKDNQIVKVPRSDVRHPPSRETLVQALEILRGKHSAGCDFSSAEDSNDLERGLRSGDILQAASIAYMLFHLDETHSSTRLQDHFHRAIDLVASAGTAMSALKRHGLIKQPSSLMPYYTKIRDRLAMAVAGDLDSLSFEVIFGTQERHDTSVRIASDKAERRRSAQPVVSTESVAACSINDVDQIVPEGEKLGAAGADIRPARHFDYPYLRKILHARQSGPQPAGIPSVGRLLYDNHPHKYYGGISPYEIKGRQVIKLTL